MKITVTKRDIRLGRKHNCEGCPIARSIRRATGDRTIQVGCDNIFLANEKYVSIPLPLKVKKFIEAFDEGEAVKPFSFTMRRPR